MSGDLLWEATRALKESTRPASDELERARERRTAQRGRERLQAALRRPGRRAKRGLYLVPLAAIFIGSTAWASGALPVAWQAVTEAVAPPLEAPVQQPALTPAVQRALVAPIVVSPAAPTTEDAAAPTEPDVDEAVAPTLPPREPDTVLAAPSIDLPPAPSPAAVAGEPIASEDTGESASPPASDPADALYRRAHAAHFAEDDPARALEQWNAYLAAAPGGRFAPEAAYNRALCLIRLGRHEAATQALTPFADGAYGTYRQGEAQKLIDALR